MAKKQIQNPSPATVAAAHIARDFAVIRKLLRQPLDKEIARGNLTGPQKAVMRVVVRQHGIGLKELSAELGLAQSTVSGIVERLTRRGIAERRADPADGRAIRIYPTQDVINFMREKMPRLIVDPLLRALSQSSATEVAAFQRAFRRLRELLERKS